MNVPPGDSVCTAAKPMRAGLQAIAQLLMIQAYPLWSLCVFAVDVLVIYGLAAHGGSSARQEA